MLSSRVRYLHVINLLQAGFVLTCAISYDELT
jgi:hypothetical protein